jgi:1-phosphofructokinase family hexose kinase
MIVTVVPNPSLDKTVLVSDFAAGQIYRPSAVMTLAGGKGFNFARALRTLGQQCLTIGPVGGYMGQYLLALAAQEGLPCDCLEVQTEVRTCLTIIDQTADNRLTELYERGVPLDESVWERLLARVASHFSEATFLAVCGSFPPGVPQSGLSDLVSQAQSAHVPVLLDTHGTQLAGVLELGAALLKVNQYEAGEMLGCAIETPEQAVTAALNLQKRGVREVVITLGKVGAVGVTSDSYPFGWQAPTVEAISPTGSGDCLFAGIAAGLSHGKPLPEAVRLGIAAGAANTLQPGAGRLELEQVQRLIQLVQPLVVSYEGQ